VGGIQVTTPTKQSKLREALKNDYIQTAILIMIIIGGVFSFWIGIKAVLRTEYPFMTVASGSMEPTLPVGSLIVVQAYADPSAIYAAPPIWDNENHTRVLEGGDIVIFWHWPPIEGVSHVVHRAIGKVTDGSGKTYLITQGDHNSGPDTHNNLTTPHAVLPGLPWEYVVGKVVANAPYIGNILISLQYPEVRIIIIVLIVALVTVEFIPFSKKKDKEQVPEQEQVKA
jgi:signal peptidase I